MNFSDATFDWDEGNTAKCQKHGLSILEIEAFFALDLLVFEDIRHSAVERRLVAVGRGRLGKPVFVGFTIRFRDNHPLIRPVTARFMREKEYLRYAKADPGI
jgi:uncharacterized DUF497 family protein